MQEAFKYTGHVIPSWRFNCVEALQLVFIIPVSPKTLYKNNINDYNNYYHCIHAYTTSRINKKESM